jgi:hypothetical protein
MGAVVGLIYLVGMVGAVAVARSRAGLSQRGRLSAATMASSPIWMGHQIAAMLLWPVFLTVWLTRGRPESPWRTTQTRRGAIRVVRTDTAQH